MGITIHFDGKLRDEAAYQKLVAAAQLFAEGEGWAFSPIAEKEVTLVRARATGEETYVGPTKGICLQPHENSEPLRLEFDRNLEIQEYVKTQFAPIEVHQQVAALLKELQPHFETLTVVDEGEFFESGDLQRLEDLREGCFKALDSMLENAEKHHGPVRLENGRIVDVMTND